MTPEQFAAQEGLISSIAETKADAVLRAVVILHTRLGSQLVAKGIFTKEEYAASISALQAIAVGARHSAPELFRVLSTATMMLGQAFDEPPEGAPS